ncbi:MAG: sulfide/dihydroorotate dehydrogenase-like FAD/NAD-binding protein [Phycisphaerae bacterium]|nr:sulfide/dihydroorotate dehydrogenase-like FAD/NAD-binding protein [Phycisphaerae bacterium]
MPHTIRSIRPLATDVFTAEVDAPLIARSRQPGQFVILSVSSEYGERIPLTIADADSDRGTIRLIWQRVGKTTAELAGLREGQSIANIVGPLGRPTHIDQWGTVVCVAGGIGSAPLLPIAKGLKAKGNRLIAILGARSRDRLILEDDFRQVCDELIVTTDDGSHGRKALVTEPLREVCLRRPGPGQAFVVGPAMMMKFCCEVTREHGVPTVVSLNTIMVDGTGMCGGCRVEVGGKPQFVCVDGPEFDGHQVNFDLMIRRLDAYKDLERRALEQYRDHPCRIGLGSGAQHGAERS